MMELSINVMLQDFQTLLCRENMIQAPCRRLYKASTATAHLLHFTTSRFSSHMLWQTEGVVDFVVLRS